MQVDTNSNTDIFTHSKHAFNIILLLILNNNNDNNNG